MRPMLRPVTAILSASLTNGATSAVINVDTLPSGQTSPPRHLCFVIKTTTADVVSNAPSVLKLQHSATTDATNYSDVSGSVGGTDWTIGNALTTSGLINTYLMYVDNPSGRLKRYVKVVVSPRTTMTVWAECLMFNMPQTPDSTALANAQAIVSI